MFWNKHLFLCKRCLLNLWHGMTLNTMCGMQIFENYHWRWPLEYFCNSFQGVRMNFIPFRVVFLLWPNNNFLKFLHMHARVFAWILKRESNLGFCSSCTRIFEKLVSNYLISREDLMWGSWLSHMCRHTQCRRATCAQNWLRLFLSSFVSYSFFYLTARKNNVAEQRHGLEL
jgi:hypothetical protein